MNFGIIGSNFIVERFIEAGKHHPDFFVVCCYSRSIEQAKINSEKWGAKSYTDDIFELAAKPDVQAVYIASPNKFHAQHIKIMLEHGKHVLCEKPITSNARDFSLLLELARSRNLMLMEAMRPLFLPCMDDIEQAVKKLGKLRYVNLPYCQYSSRYDKFKQGIMENAFNPALHNGALLDIGVYCVAWAEKLFGIPKNLQAYGSFLPHSIDSNGTILMDYGDMQLTAVYSKVHDMNIGAVIAGENGELELKPFPIVRSINVRLRGKEAEVINFDMKQNDMFYEIDAFVNMDLDRIEEYQNHSLNSLYIMDTVRRLVGIDFEI